MYRQFALLSLHCQLFREDSTPYLVLPKLTVLAVYTMCVVSNYLDAKYILEKLRHL
jgi:hypothetical protein